MEIKWTDSDPKTSERRFIRATRHAGLWKFHYRSARRSIWTRLYPPTIDMWEEVLDALERRYRRREGVTDDDLALVRGILATLRARHEVAEEE